MRLAIYRSGKDRCLTFASRARIGAESRGWTVEEYGAYGDPHLADFALVNGVRRRELFAALGQRYAYVDKGYTRVGTWRRVAVGDCEPTRYLGRLGYPDDRRRARGWEPVPWRTSGSHVLLVWQNEAEAEWRGLPAPEDHAEAVVSELRRYTDRPIVYRCKPNRAPARPVAGAAMSPPGRLIEADLSGAHCAVCVGGSSSLWALLAGIPTIALGDTVAEPVSSRCLADVEHPLLATGEERRALLNDLAYCQWYGDEWRSGAAWDHILSLENRV